MRYLWLVVLLVGCTHTRMISGGDQDDLAMLQQRAKAKEILIELENGEKYKGVLISGTPDSLRWQDVSTNSYQARPFDAPAKCYKCFITF